MKKLRYLLLLFCFMFIVSGCGGKKEIEKEEEVSSATPLLLEVTKEGVNNKLFLFGSIHAGDETLYPLPDYVINAYNESEKIAVEFDLIEYQKDISEQTKHISKFVNPGGNSIEEYIDEDVYSKAVDILSNAGLYASIYDIYNPMMWQSLIENAVIKDANLGATFGIDNHFLELSKKDKKEIIELESAEFQYDLLSGFDIKTQAYLLKQSVDEYDEEVKSLKELFNLYKKGDEKELESVLFVEDENASKELVEYNDKLITKRNQAMTESLEKVLSDDANDDVFCTVGLAHIIGDGGIADLLEQKGYVVKIVK